VLNTPDRNERAGFSKLHELLVAADMDLARMTYLTMDELRAYCARSGGAIQELAALQLAAPALLDDPARIATTRLGIATRQTEMLRDLRQDARAGRLYLPLHELEADNVSIEQLRGREVATEVKIVLGRFRDEVIAEMDDAERRLSPALRAQLRPLIVLAALHRRLLIRIAHRHYDVATERIELGPLEKPWIAWRAARKADSGRRTADGG
jgi:phytoene synthase